MTDEDEKRYRADYRAGETYALKRCAQGAATAFALGCWGLVDGLPEGYRDSDSLLWSGISGGLTALGAYYLVDCVRRFRRARRSGRSSGPA